MPNQSEVIAIPPNMTPTQSAVSVVRTPEEINALKENWLSDPCWDIEETEGFEAHREELCTFRKAKEQEWEDNHARTLAAEAKRLGVSVEDARKIQVEEGMSERGKEQAKKYFTHFMRLLKKDWYWEFDGEVDCMLSGIVDAAVAEVKIEIIKRLSMSQDSEETA